MIKHTIKNYADIVIMSDIYQIHKIFFVAKTPIYVIIIFCVIFVIGWRLKYWSHIDTSYPQSLQILTIKRQGMQNTL